MAKSAAERQRARRERLRNDPEAYDAYKEIDRLRKKQTREAMTEKEKIVLRKQQN